jgi:response regulator of citrate/malate metabolism
MYSTDTHPETIAEAKRLGATDFLIKGSIGFEKARGPDLRVGWRT